MNVEFMKKLIEEFERVWPWLEPSLERYGHTHTKDDVFQRIISNKAQLWTDEEAAVVSSIEAFPTGFIEIYGWLTGGKIEGVLRLEKRIEEWGRSIKANRMSLIGRRGFLKALPEYKEQAVHMTKDITDGEE